MILESAAGFDDVKTEITDVPFYTKSACSDPSGAAVWVGIGGTGANNNDLIQSGFGSEGSDNGIEFWWELINDSGGGTFHWTPTPGISGLEDVSFETQYAPTNNTAEFDFYNHTSGIFAAAYNITDPQPFYNGNSAEFIVERPKINGQVVRLRKGTDSSGYSPFWKNAYVNGVGAGYYASQYQVSETMYDNDAGTGNPLDTTVLGASTTQSNTWHACGTPY